MDTFNWFKHSLSASYTILSCNYVIIMPLKHEQRPYWGIFQDYDP